MRRLFLLLICLLVPATSWAFPDNGVLDTFSTGVDNDSPPNTNWINGWTQLANKALRLVGGGVTTTVTDDSGNAYWNAATFSAYCEAYATIVGASGTAPQYQAACRLQNIGASTTDGYNVLLNKNNSTIGIYVRTNGTATLLGANITKTISVGDKFGIRTIGSGICAWYKTGGADWAEVGCRTDATYLTGGKIGLGVVGGNTAAMVDDFGGGSAAATCSGASPTWTALSASKTAVFDCINIAADGDTINIPAGTATWDAPGLGNLYIDKSLKIIGAGEGSTNITLGAHINITSTVGFRLSGITFTVPSTWFIKCLYCLQFRFDHLTYTRTNGNTSIFFTSEGSPTVVPEGLIDHNTVTDGYILIYGANSGSPKGSVPWSQDLDEGTVHGIYVEDNVFTHTDATSQPASIDGSWGARIIFRFNTSNGGFVSVHGLQAFNIRGQRLWEFYGNKLSTVLYGPSTRPWNIRAGTGVAFHNEVEGTWTSTKSFAIDGPRQAYNGLVGSLGSWGLCDGASTIDENTATYEGWLCRDQIGASTDASLWTSSPPAQSKYPAYFWDNIRTDTSAELDVLVVCPAASTECTRQTTKQILNNRDFYKDSTSFDGTSGIGTGFLTARPATCTTGVAYWATDQGSWNTSVSNPYGVNAAGADGVLYHCSATNTWDTVGTGAYTPYTYPHPLQGVTSPEPDAPTGLRLLTQASANSACLVWTASDLAGLVGYRVYHGLSSGTYDAPITITAASAAAAHHPVTQYCYQSAKGGTHYFSVTSYNDTEQSAYATEVSATFTALSRTTSSARGGSSARDPLQ